MPITVTTGGKVLGQETAKRKKRREAVTYDLLDPDNLITGRQADSTYVTFDSDLNKLKVVNK